MMEVIKKEVLKLLDVGINHHICDSKYFGLVRVVPKKGGMTVVKNDKGEKFSTRIVTGWCMCIHYR